MSLVGEKLAPISVHFFISRDLSRISARDVKSVAKISPPKQCPDLHGLHVHRLTSTFHQHQLSNQIVSIFGRPTELVYQKVRPTKEAAKSTCAKHRQMFSFTRENGGWRRYVRLSKKKMIRPMRAVGRIIYGCPAAIRGHPVVNQPHNQPNNQRVNQQITTNKKRINQPIKQQMNQPINQSTNKQKKVGKIQKYMNNSQ